MSDLLVVKVNAMYKAHDLRCIHEGLVKQKATGVIILPPGCEAIVVPDDVEIKVEKEKENE
jgi:hypothetical protein